MNKTVIGLVLGLVGIVFTVQMYMYNVEKTMEKDLGIKDFWNLRGERHVSEIVSPTKEILIPTPANIETESTN